LWVEFCCGFVIVNPMKLFIPFFLFLGLSVAGGKTLDDVLTKARAYVGPEETINAVEVLFYNGTLAPADGEASKSISLLLQKPAKQRLEITEGNNRMTMVVNDEEGFMVRENVATGEKQTMALPIQQVRLFTANAAENLYFFDFPPGIRVRAKYLGEQEFRGETVDAVRFIHPHGIIFLRYFDTETGELVGTQSDGSTINIEEGEMTVGGLRFADKVLAYDSDELVHTISFDRIEVNPDIPEGLFDYPE